jgi:hypothetical protein
MGDLHRFALLVRCRHEQLTGGAVTLGGERRLSRLAPLTGQPTPAQACVIPATGAAAAAWQSAAVVAGVNKTATDHYQGFYSQSYDDAWPAPTLVFKAAGVPDGAVFAWLIVPTSARGPCADTAEVVSATAAAAVVRVNVAGAEHTVSVPLGA